MAAILLPKYKPINEEERACYDDLFQAIERECRGDHTFEAIAEFLRSSAVPMASLREIWDLSITSHGLSKADIFTLLRYVSLAQSLLPISADTLVNTVGTSFLPPRFYSFMPTKGEGTASTHRTAGDSPEKQAFSTARFLAHQLSTPSSRSRSRNSKNNNSSGHDSHSGSSGRSGVKIDVLDSWVTLSMEGGVLSSVDRGTGHVTPIRVDSSSDSEREGGLDNDEDAMESTMDEVYRKGRHYYTNSNSSGRGGKAVEVVPASPLEEDLLHLLSPGRRSARSQYSPQKKDQQQRQQQQQQQSRNSSDKSCVSLSSATASSSKREGGGSVGSATRNSWVGPPTEGGTTPAAPSRSTHTINGSGRSSRSSGGGSASKLTLDLGDRPTQQEETFKTPTHSTRGSSNGSSNSNSNSNRVSRGSLLPSGTHSSGHNSHSSSSGRSGVKIDVLDSRVTLSMEGGVLSSVDRGTGHVTPIRVDSISSNSSEREDRDRGGKFGRCRSEEEDDDTADNTSGSAVVDEEFHKDRHEGSVVSSLRNFDGDEETLGRHCSDRSSGGGSNRTSNSRSTSGRRDRAEAKSDEWARGDSKVTNNQSGTGDHQQQLQHQSPTVSARRPQQQQQKDPTASTHSTPTRESDLRQATLSDKRAQKEALLAELEQVQEETARHQEALLVCAAEAAAATHLEKAQAEELLYLNAELSVLRRVLASSKTARDNTATQLASLQQSSLSERKYTHSLAELREMQAEIQTIRAEMILLQNVAVRLTHD